MLLLVMVRNLNWFEQSPRACQSLKTANSTTCSVTGTVNYSISPYLWPKRFFNKACEEIWRTLTTEFSIRIPANSIAAIDNLSSPWWSKLKGIKGLVSVETVVLSRFGSETRIFISGPSHENRQRCKLRVTLNNPESYKFYKILFDLK